MNTNKQNEEKLKAQYINSFPLIIILFMINISLYVLLSKIAIYGFFIIGIIEYLLAKKRTKNLKINFFLSFSIPLFLLISGFVYLISNNKSIGLPLGTLGLIFLLVIRIILMTKKNNSFTQELKLPKIFSVEVFILLLLNFYIINYYNYQNKILWKAEISSGITSTLKFNDNQIKVLTNDDFLMKNFFNFSQTYTIDTKTGKIKNITNGYEFKEEFKPFKEKVKNIKQYNLEIKVSKDKVIIKDTKTQKIYMKFLANGNIISTPILNNTTLYFIINGKTFLDKIKRTTIYAIDISEYISK